MASHLASARLIGLPRAIRRDLKDSRERRGWSQAELGQRVGLPQTHISGIESGKVVPRFNTLLDLVRVLDYDVLMVPRALVPVVQAQIRDYRRPGDSRSEEGEQPLYATGNDEGEEGQDHQDEV